MASFTLFSNLPVELQLAVWALCIPGPEPEVCIVWPLGIEEYASEPEEPALPFIVDTAWPAVAHVCRAAREAVFSSGALRLRHSRVAGCAVPFRHFIPAIDTLYWGRYQAGAMRIFLRKPENAHVALGLRHLAVEVGAGYTHSELAGLIRQRAVYLRTLSFVLPGTMGNVCSPTRSFLPPARRCKLRDISDETLDRIKMVRVFYREELEDIPLREYLLRQRGIMDDYVREFAVLHDGDEGTAWSDRDCCFSGLEIKTQTFVEYTTTQNNQAQWVEVCKDRLLGHELEDHVAPEPRHIPVADRKNPEDYRVLDDDSALYSTEEFKLTLQTGYVNVHGSGNVFF